MNPKMINIGEKIDFFKKIIGEKIVKMENNEKDTESPEM